MVLAPDSGYKLAARGCKKKEAAHQTLVTAAPNFGNVQILDERIIASHYCQGCEGHPRKASKLRVAYIASGTVDTTVAVARLVS